MNNLIIKIAVPKNEQKVYDYIDITEIKFSNKEDFSDDFKVKSILIKTNEGKVINVEKGIELPENVDSDIKYIKLTLLNEQYNKDVIKEYYIKWSRSVGVEMVNGKAEAKVQRQYVLHNPDDYAYKHYMGYTDYEKSYFVDGQRVPKFYMGYRTKLNKVNRILNDIGSEKISILQNMEDSEANAPEYIPPKPEVSEIDQDDEEDDDCYIPIEDASFEIMDEDECFDLEPGEITIFIHDVNGDDNVRGVKHTDWDNYWDNVMENTFVSDKFKDKQEAIEWLNDIGIYE